MAVVQEGDTTGTNVNLRLASPLVPTSACTPTATVVLTAQSTGLVSPSSRREAHSFDGPLLRLGRTFGSVGPQTQSLPSAILSSIAIHAADWEAGVSLSIVVRDDDSFQLP